MAGGSLKAGGALVEMTVDADMSEFPVLEAGLMVAGVVMGKRHIIVAAGPSDFGTSNGDFFLFSQRG